MVFAVQGSKDRSEIEMTLELRTLWFEDLKKQDPQTSKYFDGTARGLRTGPTTQTLPPDCNFHFV